MVAGDKVYWHIFKASFSNVDFSAAVRIKKNQKCIDFQEKHLTIFFATFSNQVFLFFSAQGGLYFILHTK